MLIALEGIDGAGKRTQLGMLAKAIAERGIPCQTVSFPIYGSFFGRLVERYLSGEFGPLETVNPTFSALLFAGDRLAQKGVLQSALESGKTVLADRYVASNLAHQGARVAAGERGRFLDWLRRLEYEEFGMPVEDLVLYLRIAPEEAQQRAQERAWRRQGEADLHETSLAHLVDAARVYDQLARGDNWITVDCTETATGKRRTPEEVHSLLMAGVEVRLARFRAAQALGAAAPETARE
jgi:dTMP kinase